VKEISFPMAIHTGYVRDFFPYSYVIDFFPYSYVRDFFPYSLCKRFLSLQGEEISFIDLGNVLFIEM
jgi:hypothetical protein